MRELFLYDGTNYKDSGEKHSHWQTITSYFDLAQKRFFYIFAAYLEGDLGSAHYGFGVVNLTSKGAKLVPVDGYFVSPSVEGGPRTHSMTRVTIPYDRANGGKKLIEFMKR